MPPKVLVSYRREQSRKLGSDLTALLQDRLDVHQDVYDVRPDDDRTGVIPQVVGASDAVVVIIGPRWLDATTPAGERCIDQRDDYVRLEIESALASGKVLVPVLPPQVEMPSPEQLPVPIRDLTKQAPHSVSEQTLTEDAERLATRIEDALKSSESGCGGALFFFLLVAVLIAVGAIALSHRIEEGPPVGVDEWRTRRNARTQDIYVRNPCPHGAQVGVRYWGRGRWQTDGWWDVPNGRRRLIARTTERVAYFHVRGQRDGAGQQRYYAGRRRVMTRSDAYRGAIIFEVPCEREIEQETEREEREPRRRRRRLR